MGRGSSLMRKAPKYCHGYIDCRGKPRWYLRRPGFKRVPLPGLPWSPSFMATYEAAMAGAKLEPGKRRVKVGSVTDLIATLSDCGVYSAFTNHAHHLSRHFGTLP